MFGILNLGNWKLFEICYLVLGIFIETNFYQVPKTQSEALGNIHLCVLVSWWQVCFFIVYTEFTIKGLAPCYHRNQKNLRVIRDGCFVKVGLRDILFIDTYHSIGMGISEFVEQVADGHPRMPGDCFIGDLNHSCTPWALRSSSTSGKSMPRLFTFPTVGIPSFVHPRR